jgi:hypothetical protein
MGLASVVTLVIWVPPFFLAGFAVGAAVLGWFGVHL